MERCCKGQSIEHSTKERGTRHSCTHNQYAPESAEEREGSNGARRSCNACAIPTIPRGENAWGTAPKARKFNGCQTLALTRKLATHGSLRSSLYTDASFNTRSCLSCYTRTLMALWFPAFPPAPTSIVRNRVTTTCSRRRF